MQLYLVKPDKGYPYITYDTPRFCGGTTLYTFSTPASHMNLPKELWHLADDLKKNEYVIIDLKHISEIFNVQNSDNK